MSAQTNQTEGPIVGVLALQGDVREHAAVLAELGATVLPVRRATELAQVQALVIPGGESTTMDKLLRAFDLRDAVIAAIDGGLPVLGSCAGMVLLARDIEGGIEGQQTLGGIPMTVRRNAFGRQVDSSEVALTWAPDGSPMHATFIRAPWVEAYDADVEVLATVVGTSDNDTHAVAVRYGKRIATAFHPEISGDHRVHQLLLDLI
ncbi:pyridoxal 5'-phosphate synthase glutaminase subunit PdxT [Demequina aurantiaca]|uniref:pyridoxal 5'-phosphate synthase glutaminase subunit PdxT n=1 Tax=Demequina aurantiaca TaxID=676200 RepID=UPI00078356A4|nr:pyridoxal 5'-phosphate synthase glutaminase subunit PdxT [Demequina aurantiaca]